MDGETNIAPPDTEECQACGDACTDDGDLFWNADGTAFLCAECHGHYEELGIDYQ